MNIKGFEVRLGKNEAGQCLYITNRLRTGAISLVIGDERPSVGDVRGKRWDISEERFADLWSRVDHKMKISKPTEKVYEPTETPEISELREGMIETPEIRETPEKAVRKPRALKPRKPRVVIHD